jgi:acetyltransferase
LRLRFFSPVKTSSHTFVVRFTQIDYARAMAFIAIEEATGRDAWRRAPARERDL